MKRFRFSFLSIFALVLVVLPGTVFASRTDLMLAEMQRQTAVSIAEDTALVTSEQVFVAEVTGSLSFNSFIAQAYKALELMPAYTTTPFEGVATELIPYVEDLRQRGILSYSEFNKNFNGERVIHTWKAANIVLQLTGAEIPPVFDQDAFLLQYPHLRSGAHYGPTLMRAAQLGLFKSTSKLNPFAPITSSQLEFMIKAALNAETTLSQPAPSSGSTPIQIPTEYEDLFTDDTFLIFLDVYGKVTQEHIDAGLVNSDLLLYGAIEGLVESLDDPYSTFQDPSIASAFQNSLNNQIQGIGASLEQTDEGRIVIITPLTGSPAEKAGLRPGDIIVGVNGTDVINKQLSEVISLIQGPAGSNVTLTVQRDSVRLSITITRERITIPTVIAETTFDDILYVQITNFGLGTGSRFDQLISQTDIDSLNGLVLDLRYNPGGYLSGATEIADYFVEPGQTLTRLVGPQVTETTVAKREATLAGIPTVVLINEGSASAAEILAGILRDYDLATIVGQRSFGKGTVQEITTYTDSSALKLTVAKWLTPRGFSINEVGITPDVTVELSEEDRRLDVDTQKNRAFSLLR